MNVFIPTPAFICPAVNALRTEGVTFSRAMLNDHLPGGSRFSYGRFLHDRWAEGKEFINVEWDIVPWPGALWNLDFCHHDLCVYEYPNGGFQDGYGYSLGCIKISAKFIAENPLPDEVVEADWRDVDTLFWTTVGTGKAVHIHEPGVAHCRRPGNFS